MDKGVSNEVPSTGDNFSKVKTPFVAPPPDDLILYKPLSKIIFNDKLVEVVIVACFACNAVCNPFVLAIVKLPSVLVFCLVKIFAVLVAISVVWFAVSSSILIMLFVIRLF